MEIGGGLGNADGWESADLQAASFSPQGAAGPPFSSGFRAPGFEPWHCEFSAMSLSLSFLACIIGITKPTCRAVLGEMSKGVICQDMCTHQMSSSPAALGFLLLPLPQEAGRPLPHTKVS